METTTGSMCQRRTKGTSTQPFATSRLGSRGKRLMKSRALAISLMLLPVFFSCSTCRADSLQLWMARSAIGEAGWKSWRTGEALAIWYVIQERLETRRKLGIDTDYLATLRSYSSPVNKRRTRKRWLFTLTLFNVPLPLKNHLTRLLEQANLFLSGRTTNPCPRATHFGSPRDKPQGTRMVRVRCKIKTHNVFYRVAR